MTPLKSLFRYGLIFLFASAIVLIGAEELRRRSKKLPASREWGQAMMAEFQQGVDFRKPNLAQDREAKKMESLERAKLKEDNALAPEDVDPTGVKSLINKLSN